MKYPSHINNRFWKTVGIGILTFTMLFFFTLTSYAVKPGNIPPASEDIEERLDAVENRLGELEQLIRRLHGNKAAIISKTIDSDISKEVDGVQLDLVFCIGPTGPCRNVPVSAPDYKLSSTIFKEDDDGIVFTFNEETNSGEFANIVELLTDNNNDRLGVSTTYYDGSTEVAQITGSFSQTEQGAFFIDPQVSSQIGIKDLNGFDIGSISLVIDFVQLNYNSNTNVTSVLVHYKVIFGLN